MFNRIIFRYLFCQCLFSKTFSADFNEGLKSILIGEDEKKIINNRYVKTIEHLESTFITTAILYNLLSLFITISGVLISAFISLEKLNLINSVAASVFFWIGWVLSILVIIANKTMTGFDIYHKYIVTKNLLEKYKSEGWCFVEGVHIYNSCDSHEDRYKMFCERVEEINLSNVKLLYSKNNNNVQTKSTTPERHKSI